MTVVATDKTMAAQQQATRQMIRTTITITQHQAGIQQVATQVDLQVVWIQHEQLQELKTNRVQQL